MSARWFICVVSAMYTDRVQPLIDLVRRYEALWRVRIDCARIDRPVGCESLSSELLCFLFAFERQRASNVLPRELRVFKGNVPNFWLGHLAHAIAADAGGVNA